MNSKTIRVVAAVLVGIALVLVVAAFRISHGFANRTPQTAAAGPAVAPLKTLMVVVAAKPLSANQVVKREDVALVSVAIAPAEYFKSVDEVVGRVPLVDLDSGTPVTPRLFKDENLLARSIPPGDQAISLKISDVIGVGSFVQPGDHVDVLVYLRGDPTDQLQTQARILLPNALILSFDDRIVATPKGLKDPNNPQQPNFQHERTAVVAVPMDDTTRVMLGASMGEVRLALRRELPSAQSVALAAPLGAAGPHAEKVALDKPLSAAELGRMAVAITAKPVAHKVSRKEEPDEVLIIRGCKCAEGRS